MCIGIVFCTPVAFLLLFTKIVQLMKVALLCGKIFFRESPALSSRQLQSPLSANSLITASSSTRFSPMRTLNSSSGGLFISAPGKIILFGEHAVVYGKTAVAGSIDLRTYVSLYTSADGRIYLSLPDLGIEETWELKELFKAGEKLAQECAVENGLPLPPDRVVPYAKILSGFGEDHAGAQGLAILAFWYLLLCAVQYKKDLLAVKVTIRFKLPSCVGLGSSGAYCVCVASALLQTAGIIPPPSIPVGDDGTLTWDFPHLDIIRRWSAAAESIIHGRASGLDAAICTYGGVASFKAGNAFQHLKNLPDLRVILINSKVERSTSRMVQVVKEALKSYPEVFKPIFESINAISVEAAKILHRPVLENGDSELLNGSGTSAGGGYCNEHEHHSLQSGPNTSSADVGKSSLYTAGGKRNSNTSGSGSTSDKAEKNELIEAYGRLNDLCRINNQLLITLGVGHPKVDQLCTLLARYGIHPKMTGAGGGGSVFAFLKPDTSPTLLSMIESELASLNYEFWQPSLGGPGVVCHLTKPELFNIPNAVPTLSTATPPSNPESNRSTPSLQHHARMK
uniref:Mevalonate kinase n=1 Tax=Syphacia muris TaxID=451379 RepID=A0A158R622_9BILA